MTIKKRCMLAMLFCLSVPFLVQAGGRREPEFVPVDVFRQTVAVPMPDPAGGALQVELRFGAGRLDLAPGGKRMLLEGAAEYNNELFQPTLKQQGSRVTLSAGDGRMELKEFIELWGKVKDHLNRWDLRLAPVPMELEVDLGACSARLELGGIPLRRLRLSQGFSDFSLNFDKFNPIEMEELSFTGGPSKSILKGLANANASRILCQGGGGVFFLDFSGRLRRDLYVKIETGAAEMTLSVPEEVTIEVETHTGLAVVDFRGTWNKPSERLYRHEGTRPDRGPKITVDAAVLAGSLRLWAVKGD